MRVRYAAIPRGYIIKVMEHNKVVAEYTAGNSPRCSQTYVDPNIGVPLSRLKNMARQTAGEMADDFNLDEAGVKVTGNVPVCPVEYDNGLERELWNTLVLSVPEEDRRLYDIAELWAFEEGKPIPDRNTDEWMKLYEEWHSVAFADF